MGISNSGFWQKKKVIKAKTTMADAIMAIMAEDYVTPHEPPETLDYLEAQARQFDLKKKWKRNKQKDV